MGVWSSNQTIRVLLVKPFQPVTNPLCQPPAGLLHLAGALRHRFAPNIDLRIEDLRLEQRGPQAVARILQGQPFDLVGISALNFEAEAARAIAAACRKVNPDCLIALGGPFAHSSPARTVAPPVFDWVFHGEADQAFPDAVAAHFYGDGALADIPELSWRPDRNATHIRNPGSAAIRNLDTLPTPAYDLVDFDAYAARPNMNGWLKGTRYAPIFTSRGCPFKCNYCHDIFGKTFRWRSPEHVLAEIALLHEHFGIDEFQIIDDIFNLHKPRMRKIAELVIARFGPRKLHFCFPNGIRADIFDLDDIPLLRDMGVFQISVAIETVTPRLQQLTEKHLDIARVESVIAACDDHGIATKGFFMLGFPTETPEEIEATVRFAVRSRLTFAGFYLVIPQEGTPLHRLAKAEASEAVERVALKDFYNDASWYQLAYGTNLRAIQRRAFRRFFLRGWRMWRIARVVSPRSLFEGFVQFLKIVSAMDPVLGGKRRPVRNRPPPPPDHKSDRDTEELAA